MDHQPIVDLHTGHFIPLAETTGQVETEQQLAFLQRQDCDFVQGFPPSVEHPEAVDRLICAEVPRLSGPRGAVGDADGRRYPQQHH